MGLYPLLMAIDVGTTNVRSFIFNDRGVVVGKAFRELKIYRPRPDWAEEDPEEMLRAVVETMRDAFKDSRALPEDVAMISFSAQMHGVCMVDKEGSALSRLITWLDLRSAEQCERLCRLMDPYELYKRTGCPPLFIYPLAKILWVKQHLPRTFKKCFKILSAKDFVINKVLGELLLDHSVASGSQLLNIHRLRWDGEVLELAGIDEDKLPSLNDGLKAVGGLPKETAKLTGLKAGTPIILGASDGALSNVGLGSIREGVAAMNIGSSGALRVTSNKPLVDGSKQMRFFCYYLGLNRWVPGGAVNNAGVVLRWFKDVLGQWEVEAAKGSGLDPYEVLVKEAEVVKPGAEGLLILPFLSGERFPVRDPEAKGIVFGLTLAHSKAHFIRALMEGVVFTLRWVMEAMEGQGIKISEVRVSGGGARSYLWRQIQSDILGKPIIHTKVEEASTLGAAMLAAISLGLYKDLEEASRFMVRPIGLHEPNLEASRKYEAMFKAYKKIYSASRTLTILR